MNILEDEFRELEEQNLWAVTFWEIQQESHSYKLSTTDAKDPANKGLNRYRDIHPYNQTRIKLQKGDVGYINASLIEAPLARRKYILTQGPLTRTVGHFWQMVWEQKTRAIIMLNNFVENHQQKCADYFPRGADAGSAEEMMCKDTQFKVTYLKQEVHQFYTLRTLLLEDLESDASREILHFHYTRWSDFSVPQSPAAFLHFLYNVRLSGSLADNVGPPVIHCSAGVGRSGTLCLVDSCLVQIEQKGNTSGIDVKQQLLDMRRYRQGLIQTWQQLRFSYCAILEGGKLILRGDNLSSLPLQITGDVDGVPPPLPPKRPHTRPQSMVDGHKTEENIKQNEIKDSSSPSDGISSSALLHDIQPKTHSRLSSSSADQMTSSGAEQELRKRKREERDKKNKKLGEKVAEMKRKQRRSEAWQQNRHYEASSSHSSLHKARVAPNRSHKS